MKFGVGNRVACASIFLAGLLLQSHGVTADPLRFEAEGPNTQLHDCNVKALHTGHSGTGYVDFGGQGAWIEWKIGVPSSGEYEVSARYASKNSREADLLINGSKSGTYAFAETSDWTSWETETLEVFLNQGRQSIRISASNSAGPNIDWISIRRKNIHKEPAKQTVALKPGDHMTKGDYVFSPSGKFKLGVSSSGDFVLEDQRSNVVWSAGVSGGHRCFMQDDGNLILRDINHVLKWTTHTSNNHGAMLIVDDAGRAAVYQGTTPLWVDGLPFGQYTGPSSSDLPFPIRGAFYYPWYPETWTVNGAQARFEPKLDFYSSGDPLVVESHVDQLEYANVGLAIASWWGPGTMLDRVRITLLMDETVAMSSQLKWSVYHEDEQQEDQSHSKIKQDLDYLKKWFAWHEAWAHIDGRPVIFVYNEKGCEVARRWKTASNGEWYVVLKLFKGFRECSVQPDSWHQYGPADAVIELEAFSYSISPGFWRADIDTPLLPRLNETTWRKNVKNMVASDQPWQLITTFNEAGEGTMIEASRHWDSDTGYGFYLDALHDIY
jgi:hypothetical protein